jgi:polysaccharide export outer membrane protein
MTLLLKCVHGVLVLSLVTACGTLPQVGPNQRQVLAGVDQGEGSPFVVSIDNQVARDARLNEPLSFPNEFTSAIPLPADMIYPGDTLGLTVWENVDTGLFGNAVANQTVLQDMQVDGDGFIFVPYAGSVRAAGKTPEALREVITKKLEEQTPDPQVEVRRLAGNGRTVSITGAVAAQGVYPIERPTLRLAGMIASAGGLSIPPGIAVVTVIRRDQSGKIWFNDLQKDSEVNIALRDGDRILVDQDSRAFTILGAAASQAQVDFGSENLSLLQALAKVGGLSAGSSNPRGIFIIRDERPEVANRVLGRTDLRGTQRMIYVLNLIEPNGLFVAREFRIRNQDTIYVTEAPFAKWSKVISALTGTLGAVGSVSTASSTLQGDF